MKSVGVGAAFNGVGKITETIDAAGEAVKVVEKGGISKLLGGAMEKSGSIGSALIKGGLKAAESYVTSVATAYTNELVTKTFTGGDWSDWSNANESWYSAGTIAGALSAGLATGMGAALGKGGVFSDAAAERFETLGITKIAATGAGELGKYAGYVTYDMLLNKSRLGDALVAGAKTYADNGVTFNLANLGSIIDVFDGAGTGNWAKDFSNAGLFEINISSSGVSAQIGTGGIDTIGLAGAVYDFTTNISFEDWENVKFFASEKIYEGKDALVGWGKDLLKGFGISLNGTEISGDPLQIAKKVEGAVTSGKSVEEYYNKIYAEPVSGIPEKPTDIKPAENLLGLQKNLLPKIGDIMLDGNSLYNLSYGLTGKGIDAVAAPFGLVFPKILPLDASISDIKVDEIVTGTQFSINKTTWLSKTAISSSTLSFEQVFATNSATVSLSNDYTKMLDSNTKISAGVGIMYNTQTRSVDVPVSLNFASDISNKLQFGAGVEINDPLNKPSVGVSLHIRNLVGGK